MIVRHDGKYDISCAITNGGCWARQARGWGCDEERVWKQWVDNLGGKNGVRNENLWRAGSSWTMSCGRQWQRLLLLPGLRLLMLAGAGSRHADQLRSTPADGDADRLTERERRLMPTGTEQNRTELSLLHKGTCSDAQYLLNSVRGWCTISGDVHSERGTKSLITKWLLFTCICLSCSLSLP
jgi:hypothetical protein